MGVVCQVPGHETWKAGRDPANLINRRSHVSWARLGEENRNWTDLPTPYLSFNMSIEYVYKKKGKSGHQLGQQGQRKGKNFTQDVQACWIQHIERWVKAEMDRKCGNSVTVG